MKRFKFQASVLFAVLMLFFAGCGGGGGGGGGGTPPGNGGGPGDTPGDGPGANTGVTFERGALGSLQGSTFSTASAINDSNMVVGIADDIEGDVHAVQWTVVGTTPALAMRFELLPGGTFGAAYDINNAGQVVGEGEDANLDTRAILWQGVSGSPITFPSLPGARFSAAFGINDLGMVVGESSDPPAADGTVKTHAVFWTVNPEGVVTSGTPMPLGEPSGFASSSAFFVNNADQVVGEAVRGDGTTSGVLWALVPGSVPTATLLPPLSGHVSSAALGINGIGQVVGESESSEGVKHAVLWNVAALPPVAEDLGALVADSTAAAINDAGLIAGWLSPTAGAVPTSALWSTASATQGTSDPILGEGVSAQAFGINSAGNVVGLSLTENGAFLGIAR